MKPDAFDPREREQTRGSAPTSPASPCTGARLVTVAELADWLAVEPGWVYANAGRLGAMRLGAGPKTRLRFDVELVRERLSAAGACSVSRRFFSNRSERLAT